MLKLKHILTEKKNKYGVPIVTKKSDVNKILKQLEKAEKALDNVRVMCQNLSIPALENARKEHHSWQDAYRVGKVDRNDVPNMNYKTEAEQYWHNFRDQLTGGVLWTIRKTDDSIQRAKSDLKNLLGIV